MKLVKYLFLSVLCSVSLSSCIKPGQYIVSFNYDDSIYFSGSTYYEEEINKIDIHWINGSIDIKYRDDELYKIDVYEKYNGLDSVDSILEVRAMRTVISNKELKIYFCASGNNYFPNKFNKDLIITLPKELKLDSIYSHSIDSKDNFSSLDSSYYHLYSVSGSINVNNITAEDIDIETVSASLNIDKINITNNIDIDTVSGNSKITNAKSMKTNIDTVSGNIEIKNIDSEIAIDSTSGNTIYSLNENEGFNINFTTVSGSFSSNVDYNRNGNIYTYNGETITYINCDTVSGSINVNKPQTV